MKHVDTFKQLLFPYNNCEFATNEFCRQLKISVTKTTLQKQLQKHPDYPSLLAISDVLKNDGVDNVAINTIVNQLQDLPIPMIAQVNDSGVGKVFTVVSAIDNNQITYLQSNTPSYVTNTLEEFQKIFTGVVLLAEVGEHAGEKDYTKHLQEEKRTTSTKILSAAIVPLLTIIACIICLSNYGTSSIAAIIYTLLALAGTTVGALLLWYEVDKYNPALQQICSGGKKVNCNAVLSSDASKIFGISWSAIGFTYFAGSLLSLLVSGIYNISVLNILSWLNVLALPYIAFSLYYQSKIAKQWCVLCLTVQAILALQFVTELFGKFFSISSLETVQLSTAFTILACFAIPFLVVSLLLPALRSAKENKQNKNELQKLKHNLQIFEALLVKQKAITEPTDGLGITLGNPNAKYKLIKVCNPYCGPCATAHPIIEDLLDNNPDVQVQIIFSAYDNEYDITAKPARHLLAISAENEEAFTRQALDDWYLAEKKDYYVYATKYPIHEELKQQSDKVKAMRTWCDKTDITFTPTFFVNSYQLPEQYSIADLKYFLSV